MKALENLLYEFESFGKGNFTIDEINETINKHISKQVFPDIESNGILASPKQRKVLTGTEEYHFPKKEFDLLYYLMQNKNKCMNREEIISNVWGNDICVLDRTIDVHIRKIRNKIKKQQEFPFRLKQSPKTSHCFVQEHWRLVWMNSGFICKCGMMLF